MNIQKPGRLSRLTQRLRADGIKPLVPFLTAGYPDEATFAGVMGAAANAGCRLVEIGIPFSDPVADGPVIQAASQQVLEQGMTLRRTLELAANARSEHGLFVVLMGYLNPILKMGPIAFAAACAKAEVAGVIIPDLPPEEAAGLRKLLISQETDLVDLIAPTTSQHRLVQNIPSATGFLYLVSTTGVTGSAGADTTTLPDYVARVRATTELPLYVGFGIARPQQAAAVAAVADGAIVGSALLKTLAAAGDNAVTAASDYLTTMVQAMDTAKGRQQ